jgi:hypothetical protein
MVTNTPSVKILKKTLSQNPAIEILIDRWIALLGSIVAAGNPRRLRATINAKVTDYERLNVIFIALAESEFRAVNEKRSLTGWVNAELLDVLNSRQDEMLSKSDRNIVLDTTKALAFFETLLGETPNENKGFLAKALIDGFSAVQKLTMCLFTIVLVSDETLQPAQGKVPHWLCLAMRDYLNEWNTALMSHNPELDRRAREYDLTNKAMTDDELDAYLDL